jgi:hypothetical protein
VLRTAGVLRAAETARDYRRRKPPAAQPPRFAPSYSILIPSGFPVSSSVFNPSKIGAQPVRMPW